MINIITKTFSNTSRGTQLSGALNYGDHKLVNGHQGFSIRKGRATFGGGFSMNQSEGDFFPEKVNFAKAWETFNTSGRFFSLRINHIYILYLINIIYIFILYKLYL